MSEPHRCLNCDTPAPDSFCPRCGQSTRDRRAPFRALMREALAQLDLDTALPRSLNNLLLRPGRLTELYLAGRRASFVPPLRMYLVISVVFFLIFEIKAPDVSRTEVYIAGELVGPAQPKQEGAALKTSFQLFSPPDEATWLTVLVEDQLLAGKKEKFRQMDPQKLFDQIFGGVQRHVKVGLFVFLPLLALALKLLFLRSGSLYFDHLIFALYFQSFLFLSLSLVWIFHSSWLYALVWLVVAPVYLLRALRHVYRQRWRWLVPKFLALGLAYFLLLTQIFMVVVVTVMRGI